MTRTGRPPRRRATTGTSRGLALIAAAIAVLVAMGERLAAATSAAWHEVVAPGPARPEDAVGVLAGAAGLVLVAWLACAVVASVVAALAPSLPLVRPVASIVAPRLVRHAVAAVVGVIVVGGAATSAHAAGDPGLTNRAAVAPLLSSAQRVAGTVHPAAVDTGWRPTAGDVSPGWSPTPPASTRPTALDPRDGVQTRPRPGTTIDDEVVVRRGDTLWSIAARHLGPGATDAEIADEWPRWFMVNRGEIGEDPDRLSPGQRLRPPAVVTTGSALPAFGGAR